MIRVLHVIDHLGLGGAQTALLNLLRQRDTTRFEHVVACLHGRGEFADEFKALNVQVMSLSARRWPPFYIPALWQLLGRERFQIVHCHLFASNWIAKPIAWLRGCKVRFNHDQCNDAVRADNPFLLAVDALTNRLSTRILAVSRSTADFLRQREGISPERIVYFPNAVDVQAFPVATAEQKKHARREFGLPDEGILVGGAGRLAAQKNFSAFLQVAALVCPKNPSLHFVIFGEGPEETDLKKLAADLGLGNRVTFAGYVRDRALIYQAIDVFFLTSLYEGTPLVLLEAMAARVPIAASAVDGTAEILEHDTTARLFPASDVETAAAALQLLITDAGERTRLATAAHSKVSSEFEAQILMKRLEELYLEATGGLPIG